MKCFECADAVAQDTLYSAVVEGNYKSLRDVVVPEDSKEVHSLLGLLHQVCSVQTPGHVLADVDFQEVEA